MCVALAASLLVLAGCASKAASTGRPVPLAGWVLSAPRCPVERVGSPCPPGSVAGATVEALQMAQVVASTRSDGSGRFVLRLVPGRYLIRATNAGAYASTAERSVLVRAGTSSALTLVVDSGIR